MINYYVLNMMYFCVVHGIHDLENIHPWEVLIGMCNWVAMTV